MLRKSTTMAKLAIFLALFSLLALHQVTAFRTTVTTTVVEEDERRDPGQQQQCDEQIRRQRSLQSCQRYLWQQQQQSFYDVAMVVDAENPPQKEGLSQCCSELEKIEEQCRCQAVSHAFKQQHQHQQGQSARQQQERQARQLAENLPSRCNLGSERCQVKSE